MPSIRINSQRLLAFCFCFSLSFSSLPQAGWAASFDPVRRAGGPGERNKSRHITGTSGPDNQEELARQSADASIRYLAQVMDQFHDRFPVYDDVSSAGNHFHVYTKIPDANASVMINGSATDNTHSGATAIECKFLSAGGPFGGYYFQNGVLPDNQTVPQPNFGTIPNAGVTELINATALTFWVRGAVGGEKIDFFMGGRWVRH